MADMVALAVLATVLELVGFVLAALGFHHTWREHAVGKDFWELDKARARTTVRRADRALRKMLRRPPRPVDVDLVPAQVTVTPVALRVTTGLPPLPGHDDMDALTAEIDKRLNRLHSVIEDVQHALTDEREAREDGDRRVRSDLEKEIDRVEASTQRVAVGGLRLQLLGWIFLLLGLILGAVVNVADAASDAPSAHGIVARVS
jgi:hypothetical protein